MKIFHVTLALFFSMLLMLPLQCANAEALLEQDGIVVEFITNKVDYTSNEDVSATVKVTNSRMQTIQGVSIDVELPASFELKDGSLAEDSIQLQEKNTTPNVIHHLFEEVAIHPAPL